MLQVVIDRILLLLFGIPRPAMPPFQKLITADLVLLPPVAERDAAGVAELRYGVGRAAAEPCERLDGLRPLLCAVHPYGPPGPLLVQDFHRSPPVDKKLTKRTVPDARKRSMRPAHMSRLAP